MRWIHELMNKNPYPSLKFWVAVMCLLTAHPLVARHAQRATHSTPTFRPEIFFQGHTEGTGFLKVIFRQRRSVHVHGQGQRSPDGTVTLDQEIKETGSPLKHRRWQIRAVGEGRYIATLSDAIGPVVGDVQGNVMRLAFSTKGGLRVRQVLTLAPDGRSVDNRLTIRKFGIVVAVLNEKIVHVD